MQEQANMNDQDYKSYPDKKDEYSSEANDAKRNMSEMDIMKSRSSGNSMQYKQ